MASISGPDPGRAGVQDRYLENDCLRNGERNPFRQHQGMALSGEDVERFPRRYPARSMTVARHSDTPETQSIRTLRVGEQERSEERSVGRERVRTCMARGSPYTNKKKKANRNN